MRVEQPVGTRGSLKWVQSLVGRRRDLIEPMLRSAVDLAPAIDIDWRSPLAEDSWAEYRDHDFLDRLELGHLSSDLEHFWPRRGPQWDALARTSNEKSLLFEAKAHAPELASSCAASPSSRTKIERALEGARAHFGASPGADWLTGYYQYANRLAHLYFLRTHGVDAHLLFVYMLNDHEMRRPTSHLQWNEALSDVYRHLGFEPGVPIAGVHSLYLDVQPLIMPAALA